MKEVEIQKKLIAWIDCPTCKGKGGECKECQGSGKIRKPRPIRNFKKTLL
jgi:DnaJ-class molecular chaperone